MPQIKIRGMSLEKICSVSQEMLSQLQQIIDCPKEDLTLEYIPTTFISDGKPAAGYPFVEVAWFDRGQEIQDRVAETITNLIRGAGYAGVDVIFTIFEKHRYYENGKHF
ncbi:DUF1904 domain-containing protein [Desulfotomaculum varum]